LRKKHPQITTDFKVPVISYPKVYMQSIFYNLISNSLKYTREGITPVIVIRSYAKDGSTYLAVSDNGLGLNLKKYGKLLFQFQKSFHAWLRQQGNRPLPHPQPGRRPWEEISVLKARRTMGALLR
jgi:light-regulated signal transduction histidine kinase (bacteriophytochrome)